MMDALWCPDGCKSFGWFCGQFFSPTCGITQCLLRKKVLNYDMTKYSCFQGFRFKAESLLVGMFSDKLFRIVIA